MLSPFMPLRKPVARGFAGMWSTENGVKFEHIRGFVWG